MPTTTPAPLAGLPFARSVKDGHTAYILRRDELRELPHSRVTGQYGGPRQTIYRIASVDDGWTLDEWDAVVWVQVSRSRSRFNPYPDPESAARHLRELRDHLIPAPGGA